MSNASRTRPESFLRWKPVLLNFSRSLFNNQHRYFHTEPSLTNNTLRINLSMALKAWFDATQADDPDWKIFDLSTTDITQLGNLYCYYCFEIAEVPTTETANFRSAVTIFNRARLTHTAKTRPQPPGLLQFPPLAASPITETRQTNSLKGSANKLVGGEQRNLLPHTAETLILCAADLISGGYLHSIYLDGIPTNIDKLRTDYGLDVLENTPTLYQLL